MGKQLQGGYSDSPRTLSVPPESRTLEIINTFGFYSLHRAGEPAEIKVNGMMLINHAETKTGTHYLLVTGAMKNLCFIHRAVLLTSS